MHPTTGRRSPQRLLALIFNPKVHHIFPTPANVAHSPLHPIEATLARILNTRLRPVLTPADFTPIQIAAVYGLFGFSALYFSDVYLPQAIAEPGVLAQLQALKGSIEIVLTAGLIFVLTRRSRRAIEVRNERLEMLDAERGLLHRVFRHNLRQDLNVILGYGAIIFENIQGGELEPDCRKLLARIEQIERYQRKIVKIEQILDSSTACRRIDLGRMVRENSLVQQLQAADDVSISLEVPKGLEALGVPGVVEGFHEVVENGVEHNDSEEPELTITFEEGATGLIELVVADNGPGISEYEAYALESMNEEDLSHSSGLGLWLAKLSCTVSGGDLRIGDEANDGTRVCLALPEIYGRTVQRRVATLTG